MKFISRTENKMKIWDAISLAGFLIMGIGLLLLYSCGMIGETNTDSAETDLQPFVWNPTSKNPLDAGSGLVVAQHVASEPDPTDNDGGLLEDDNTGSTVAVWLEQRDENPFDDFPAIIHLYARRAVGSSWVTNDSACPADGRKENSDNDGICLIDQASGVYNTGGPRVAMDNFGNAVVVWQQSDGTDCASAASGTQECTRIFSRTFSASASSWSDCNASLNCIISETGSNRPAANPDIAVDPNGGPGSAIAVFDQWNGSTWVIRANRCVDGVADSGTACGDGAGEWDAAGTQYIGSANTNSPRIGMDSSGTAITVYIRHVLQSDCTFNVDHATDQANGGANTTNDPSIQCTDSTLNARLFSGGGWNGTVLDVDPGKSSAAVTDGAGIHILCFDRSTQVLSVEATDACVNVVEFDLAVNDSVAMLIVKTSWGNDEDWRGCTTGDSRDEHNSHENTACRPANADAEDDYKGQAIVARRYNMGSAWITASWNLTRLANFGIFGAAGTADFGTGPFPAGCTSTTTIDVVREILNCQLRSPRVAVSADGTSLAVYETFNGTTWDIRAHRYDGATWGAFTTIDNSAAGDAVAPQIAMNSSGGGVSVWVQHDGTKWRIYHNMYSAGWLPAATPIDCDVPAGKCNGFTGVAYYNPMIAENNAGLVYSLFIGSTSSASNDISTRLFGVTGP